MARPSTSQAKSTSPLCRPGAATSSGPSIAGSAAIGSVIDRLQARGVTFRYNRLADVDRLFRLNMDAFGSHSYFSDPRFLRAFEDLVVWLHSHDLLRVTTTTIAEGLTE